MTISRLSDNERAWIEFLRLSSNGTNPAPDLVSIQLLRRVIARAEKRKLALVNRERKSGTDTFPGHGPWLPRAPRRPRHR